MGKVGDRMGQQWERLAIGRLDDRMGQQWERLAIGWVYYRKA